MLIDFHNLSCYICTTQATLSTCFLPPSVQQTTTFLTKKKTEIWSEFTLKNKITFYAEYEAIWASHNRE